MIGILLGGAIVLSVLFRLSVIKPVTNFPHGEPAFNMLDARGHFPEGGYHINKGAAHRIVHLGDSTSFQFATSVANVFKDSWITSLAVAGMPSRYRVESDKDHPSDRSGFNYMNAAKLVEFDRIRREVMEQNIDLVIINERWELDDPREKKLVTEYIEEISLKVSHVILLAETPFFDIPRNIPIRRVAYNLSDGGRVKEVYVQESEISQKRRISNKSMLEELAEKLKNVIYLDPDRVFLTKKGYQFTDGVDLLFRDPSHFSLKGASKIELLLQDLVEQGVIDNPAGSDDM